MSDELLFTVHGSNVVPARPLALAEAGLRERRDLQEWVIAHPEILGPSILIVTMEFGNWRGAAGRNADRLDILGLSSDGCLVVAELKRDRAPETVEMQAIKYAAMASQFTEQTLAEQHARYLTARGSPTSDESAMELLLSHAGELNADSLRRPRIVLLASDYPPTTVATAVWLNEMGIDITLMEYHAYQTGSEISISVSRLYPIPAVEDFKISPRQVEARALEQTVRKRQDIGTVVKIIAAGVLEEDAPLTVRPYGVNDDLRQQIAEWLDQDPARRRARWSNFEEAPIRWEADGQTYTPTTVAKTVLREATGVERALRGGEWWVDAEGHSLVELAMQADGDRNPLYIAFWGQLAERAAELHPNWIPFAALGKSWFNFKSDIPGSAWDIHAGRDRPVRSGLYFSSNKLGFRKLNARRGEIERRFGQSLEWDDQPDRRYARVSTVGVGDVDKPSEWPEMIEWILESQSKLRAAIGSDGKVSSAAT